MRLASAAAVLAVLITGVPAAQDSTTDVPGSTNIWLAGGNQPTSSESGVAPPLLRIPDGATSFTARVTGTIGCCGESTGTFPPDGGGSATTITPSAGSIGPFAGSSNLPFVGVFLRGDASGGRPSELAADDDGDFRALSPALKQPFFIGDGRRPGGADQTFRIPDGANRLYLGVADGFAFQGEPGSYQDNAGSFSARIRFDNSVPTLGETANAKTVKGEVLVQLQKGGAFVPLSEAREIPIGATVDATNGTVALTTARNRAGEVQSGKFSAGLFQVLQSRKRKAKGLTELRMKGSAAKFRSCGRARAALSRRAIRRLRANAKGRYRTRGRHSAATVRGTKWVVEDRCDGTLTKVKRGKVAVRDFRLKKTILLTAGKSYLAR